MSPKNRASGIVSFSLALGLLLLPPSSAWPQTVSATVGVGSPPSSVAVNGVTNKIYVATCTTRSSTNGTVTVIDGKTDTTTTVTAGVCPWAVAVNPATNKIYVANHGFFSLICGSCISYGSVTVIDGTTNSTTTIIDPNAKFPQAVAVNPLTDKIYVANWSGNVTVIDGATNSTTTVTDPNAADPIAAAVNSVTNKIYVTNIVSNNVTVIDGASNSTTTISDPNMSTPNSVAVNPVTNKIYVANVGVFPGTPANVTVIDGATNSTTTITDPYLAPGIHTRGFSLAVNSATDKIYVADESDSNGKGHVSVIDGSTNSVITVTDPDAIAPVAVAVDPATNTIYIANGGSLFLSGSNPGSVTVIDGATDSITTVVDPKADVPNALAVNPETNTIYVANFLSANVTVIRGAVASTTWYVNGVDGSDSNNCLSPTTACKTIGHAITLAASGDSIIVAPATYTENLTISVSLKILGSGATTTIIDGGGTNTRKRAVTIPNGNAHVTLSKMTIRHGRTTPGIPGGGIYNAGTLSIQNSFLTDNTAESSFGSAGNGGGIFNNGTLTINRSTLAGNHAGTSAIGHGFGGGIANAGTLTINNSTLIGNVASSVGGGGGIGTFGGTLTVNNSTLSGNNGGDGGGIGTVNGVTVTINNSTLAKNTAFRWGGGISSFGATLAINNSTLSGNSAQTGGGIDGTVTLQNSIVANSPSGGNCHGTMTSKGYNLSSDGTCSFNRTGDMNNTNPNLGPLQNNGGPTQTMALLPGSPAIDAGNPTGCTDGLGHLLKTDQRGDPRPNTEDTGGCDIGAYERQSD
jgi:DNA-binding beta-propeller fold protein YncE